MRHPNKRRKRVRYSLTRNVRKYDDYIESELDGIDIDHAFNERKKKLIAKARMCLIAFTLALLQTPMMNMINLETATFEQCVQFKIALRRRGMKDGVRYANLETFMKRKFGRV